MPPKKQYKKRMYKKRPYYKRKYAKKYNGGLVPAIRNTGVPDRMLLRLKYTDNISLNSAAGSVWSKYPFRLNSIYDPDANLGGHQPLGYDQWQVMFNRYRVYRADVKLTIIQQNTEPTRYAMIGMNYESWPLPNDDSAFEQPHAVVRNIASNTGNNKIVLKKSFDLPRIRGMSREQYRTAQIVASQWGNNPTDQIFLGIVAHNLRDQTAQGVNAIGLIEIVYHVEAFDKRNPTISNVENNNLEEAATHNVD